MYKYINLIVQILWSLNICPFPRIYYYLRMCIHFETHPRSYDLFCDRPLWSNLWIACKKGSLLACSLKAWFYDNRASWLSRLEISYTFFDRLKRSCSVVHNDTEPQCGLLKPLVLKTKATNKSFSATYIVNTIAPSMVESSYIMN